MVNLTIPKAHAEVALAALAADKNVHNEKPLAIHHEEARQMLDLARERGLRVAVPRIPSWAAACRPAAS